MDFVIQTDVAPLEEAIRVGKAEGISSDLLEKAQQKLDALVEAQKAMEKGAVDMGATMKLADDPKTKIVMELGDKATETMKSSMSYSYSLSGSTIPWTGFSATPYKIIPLDGAAPPMA